MSRVLLAIVVLVTLIAAGVWSGARTIVVDATSGGMEIVFSGATGGAAAAENAWQLLDVTVCRLRDVPDPRATPSGRGPCAETLFSVERHAELTVTWPVGTRVEIEAGRARGLVIRVLDTPSAIYPDDTVFVVPAEVWSRRGPLVFAGTAVLGGEPKPGINTLLSDGRWEARQSSRATWFREGTEIVKSGRLVQGSRVTLQKGAEPALAYGHLIPARETGMLDVAMVSESGPIALNVTQYGTARPIVLKPDLIDLILANPALVALAIVLALTEPILSLLVLLGVIAPWSGRSNGSPQMRAATKNPQELRGADSPLDPMGEDGPPKAR